jgi:hypothetical protein
MTKPSDTPFKPTNVVFSTYGCTAESLSLAPFLGVTPAGHMKAQEQDQDIWTETEGLVEREGLLEREGVPEREGLVETEDLTEREGVTEREELAEREGVTVRQEREVVFGRVPLAGPAGMLGEHWAAKVGETWFEVGPGPNSTDGHINARLERVGSSKTNILGQYDIVESEGDQAASGARPASAAYSPTSFFWPLVLAGVGFVMSLGRTIGKCLRLEEGVRRSGALVTVLVAAIGAAWVIDSKGKFNIVLMVLFLVTFCLVGFLAVELGAPLGRAVGRRLGFGDAGVQRCGAVGALLAAISGGMLWLLTVLLVRLCWRAKAPLVAWWRGDTRWVAVPFF